MPSDLSVNTPAALPWIDAVKTFIAELPSPIPCFSATIASARDYDALFARDFTEQWNADQLLDKALATGRVLLAGRGGAGKTVVLHDCARRANAKGYIPLFIPLKNWTQDLSKSWKTIGSRFLQIDALLRDVVAYPVGIAELDSLDPGIPRILIVDGLNEIDGNLAQELIYSLDEYAATAVNTSVVVSDRFLRRDFLNIKRWSLASVLPLSSEEIARRISESEVRNHTPSSLTEDQTALLSSPYFLNAYLLSGVLASTRSTEIEGWFTAHALGQDGITKAAEAAFRVYGSGSRTFKLNEFQDVAGIDVTAQLTAAGALLVDGDVALFDHHLKHDFLASRHLASNNQLWNRDSFNRVTFDASSFDAIMMATEQVEPSEADQFIRRVYDWNIYGVGYALAESRKHHVSKEMCWVISAMFGEKTWDIVQATAQRAKDTLQLLENEEAKIFLNAESIRDVLKHVSHLEGQKSWFSDWKALFTIIEIPIADQIVELITNEDSVLGWTVANVLKRVVVSASQQSRLRTLVTSAIPIVRWRAAHALGAFPSSANASSLLAATKDEDPSVRYGAVRSVLELASRAKTTTRKRIFRNLTDQRYRLNEQRTVVQEIRRTMMIPNAVSPSEWLYMCLELIVSWQPLEPARERDKWARTAQSLILTFESVPPKES